MHYRLRPAISIVSVLSVALITSAVSSPEWQTRISKDLLDIYAANSAASGKSVKARSSTPPIQSRARYDSSNRVQVDVKFDCANKAPTSALAAAGLIIGTSLKVAPMCIVEGWVAPAALPALANVAAVKTIELPHYAVRKNPPSATLPSTQTLRKLQLRPQFGAPTTIDGEGVMLMRADQFVQQTSVTGAGVMIGVMSDDATSVARIQARGELPPNITLIASASNPSPTDEGTMMLEEAHAVAPGASLAFCGLQTSVQYVSCLTQIISAGATIVSDDIRLPTEDLMSSKSSLQSAIETILAANPAVSLFTSAGNDNQSYIQGTYNPTSLASVGSGPYSCAANGQTDYYIQGFGGLPYETLTVNVAGTFPVLLQWGDPYGANVSNFDVYVIDASTNQFLGCGGTSGSSATFAEVQATLAVGTYWIVLASPDQTLNGKYIKFWVGGDGATSFSSYSGGSVVSPQAFLPGVNSVGAVIGSDSIGNTIEFYSGVGPIQVEFPTPMQLQAPSFVAPDAIYVDATGTSFVSGLGPDGLFHGTSAASPNAAAVAALLRSAFPSLTPAQLTTALQTGAAALGPSNPNGTFGFGRVDAIGALNTIPGPTISGFTTASIVGGSSSSTLPITVSGTGALHVSVAPANLIPSPSGIVLSQNCGVSAASCTLVLTPTMGQSGPTTVQLTVTDGANRTMSYQASVTVTKPSPPTIAVTSGGAQGVTIGTAIAPVSFTLAGTGPLTVTLMSNNLASVTLGAGCGSTTLSCTANLGTASESPGAASLTVTVQDSYGQSVSSTATIMETAPPAKSGGGSIDLWSILTLGSLVFLKIALKNLREPTAASAPRRTTESYSHL